MVREILKIYTDNGLGNNNPTFKNIELTEYNAKFSRMGFPDLSATLMWATCLDDEWTGKEYVVLRGEKFFIKDTPHSEKSNTDARWKHEIEFTSEFAQILGNILFVDAVPSYAETYDKPCTNNAKFTFFGTISEFCDRLNCAFIYAGIADSVLDTKTSLTTTDTPVGDGFCVMLDQYGEGDIYDPDKSYEFSFEGKYLWEAITYGYETTEIPFERRGKCFVFGAIPKVVSHKFEYGHDNELLSIRHRNAKAKVVNRITMLGSSENIPHYYPNETEYGHISIKAKAGNKVLTASNVQIANMTQLLSRLNADSFAVLGKYNGEQIAGSEVTPAKYKYAFSNGTYKTLELNTDVKHDPSGTDRLIPWHIRVYFNVHKEGVYECKAIKGNIWTQNQTVDSKGADIIQYTTGEKLASVNNDVNNTEIADYTSQLARKNDRINFGNLKPGMYVYQFSIEVRNTAQGTTYPVVSFCRLTSVVLGEENTYKTGYYWSVGDKKYDGVGALGVKINGTVSDAMIGDGFGWEASGRMPFQDHLVPPKYRETLGVERFYNALNDTYTDPDTGNDYVFPNPFVSGAPSEHIFRDDNRKPTIEGIVNAVQRTDVNGALMFDDNGNPIYQLLGEIADIAYDVNDNDVLKPDATEDNDKNDTLKYEHSFFYIKLNIFNGTYGFDLFAHASQTDPMTIQMRDGSCNGCKFKIQALEYEDETGLKSYKNPVQTTGANGDIVSGGYADKVKESWQEWQQNTQTHSIWICVQKDAETFGVLMPNQSNNFKPKIGDKFNIINIDLPQSYIDFAEQRLEDDGIRFMADNNDEKFTFDIQASRIFFAENPQVLAQLDEYSVIKVKYNGKEYEQYVNQLTIDCKDSEALPNIGIDLTDTLAVGQSFIEQVAERASSLIANPYTMGGALGSGGGLTTRLADLRYLKKVEDDRSIGKIASDIGFEIGEFVSGGSGGIFYQDPETGQTYIEADKLKIRMKAIFEELEIAKVSTIGGKFIITPGGGLTISYVETLTNSYRCYFKAKEDDKGAECRFVVGDQVQCHEFNVQDGTTKNASNRYYWRLVTAVNNDGSYIELSKTDCDNAYEIPSDIPQAGDTIVQLGNRDDDERQSAIILSTFDAFAPCVTLYNGIDHYSLDGKSVVEYGVDKTKTPAEPFFNCYGRFFFGPKGGNSYLKFEPSVGKLIFSGELINITSLNGKDIDEYITDLIPEPDLSQYDYLKEAIKDGATTTRGGLILSSLIKLGEWNLADPDNPQQNKIWAGMNGIRNHDKTIASWWGGDMVDKYYNDSVTPRPVPLTTGYAQSLVRMDGSGYFAGGNIRWDEYGNLILGNGISLGGGSTTIGDVANLFPTVESLTLLFNKFSQALVPIKLVGDTPTPTNWADIASDLSNLYAVKSVKGFYSDEFISARGLDSVGNGGVGVTQLRMLDDVLIGNNLASGQALVYNGTKWVNQKVGLDESSLAQYLSDNYYAKLTDIPSLTGYATEQWVNNKGYLTDYTIHALTLQTGTFSAKTYNPKTGAQTVNIPTTTSHISEGTRLYFTDARAQSALASTVADLNAAIALKLPTATFDTFKSGYDTWKATVDAFVTKLNSMFELETDANSPEGKRIKAKLGLYSPYYISARGVNPDGSAGGSAFGRLDSWSNYNANGTDALSAKLGYGLKSRIEDLESKNYLDDLAISVTGTGNAVTSVSQSADKKTLTFTKGTTFLTSHQPIRTLTIQKNGTTVDTFNPTATANKTINITDVASASTLSSHTGNGTIHITANERTLWNQTATNLSAILGSDTDNVINKYEEIVAFLDTYTEADTLANLLGNKADKTTKISAGTGLTGGGTLASDRTLSLATSGVTAGTYFKTTVDAYGRVTAGSNPTTLAGYGITDAYTKTDADGRYVNVTGDTMSGDLLFADSGTSTRQVRFLVGSNDYGRIAAGATAADGGWMEIASADNGNEPVYARQYSGAFASVTRTATLLDASGNTSFPGKVTAGSLKIGECEVTWDSASGGLKFSKGIYSEGFISSRGADTASGAGGGAGYGLIRDWPASDPGSGTNDALGANLGWWLKTEVGKRALSTDLTALATRVGTAEGAVTALQTASAGHVTLGTAQTISGAKTFNAILTISPTNTSGLQDGLVLHDRGSGSSEGLRIRWTSASYTDGITLTGNPSANRITSSAEFSAQSFIKSGGTSSQFLKADGSVDSNSYALSSSLGNYLPLSGGKITSAIPSPLDVNSTDAEETGIRIQRKNTNKSWFGHNDTKGTMVYNYASNKHLGIKDDGTPVFNGSTLWHAGNDGSGSGLDADLLDGFHNGEVTAKWLGLQDTRSDNTLPNAYNNSISFHFKANTTDGLSSGGTYHSVLHFAQWKNASGGKSKQLALGDNGRMYLRYASWDDTEWGAWQNFAFTTDNVASADKLSDNASYKAWGQEFFVNGKPKAVSGNMTGVGSITMSQGIQSGGSTSGSFFGAAASGLGTSYAGALMYAYNNNPLYFYTNGVCKMFISGDGNVGIGTTSPAYKLDVNGDARIATRLGFTNGYEIAFNQNRFCFGTTNQASANGVNAGSLLVSNAWADYTKVPTNGIYVKGPLRIGDCTLTYENGALHIDKGVYSDSFVSARGSDGSSGGGGSLYGLATAWAQATSANTTDALGANLGRDLYDNKLSKTEAASTYLTKTDAATAYQPKGNYLTGHQSLANYVTTNTEQSISAKKTFIGGLKIRYNVDTSNALGIGWYATDGTTVKQSILAHNTANRIILNPNGSTSVYDDAVGKYSLIVGVNELTYNTKSILREDNYTSYVAKLGTSTVGSTSKPIYLNAGTPTALSATVGSSTKPVYLNAGTVTACSYTFGNGSGNAPISNGTVNTNLNADLLDGLHASEFFRKYGVYSANVDDITESGVYLLGTSATGTPIGNNGNQLLSFKWDVNAANQLYLRYAADEMYFRRKQGGAWQDWHQIAFTDGCVAYLSAKGTPATGSALTWWSGARTVGSASGNAYKGSSSTIGLWSFPDGGTSVSGTSANIMNLRLGWSDKYWADIFTSPNYDRLWYRRVNNGTAGTWHKLAFLDDKIPAAELADAAVKLQDNTAFKAWGKEYFSGGKPKTVDGNMSGVGNIGLLSGWTYTIGSRTAPLKNFVIGERFYVYRNLPNTDNPTTDQNGATTASYVGMMLDSYEYDYTVPAGTTSSAWKAIDKGKAKKATGIVFRGVHNDSQFASILAMAPTGRVGIGGNQYPSYELDVTGHIRATAGVYVGASAQAKLTVAGSSADTTHLHCNIGFASDSFISARGSDTSDIRLKTDIRDFIATEIIKSLHPVAFRWNAIARSKFKVFDTDAIQYGLIAQEAENAVPWLVDGNMFGDGYMGVRYARLIPVLAQSQKEQIDEVERLKLKIRELEDRIAYLENN